MATHNSHLYNNLHSSFRLDVKLDEYGYDRLEQENKLHMACSGKHCCFLNAFCVFLFKLILGLIRIRSLNLDQTNGMVFKQSLDLRIVKNIILKVIHTFYESFQYQICFQKLYDLFQIFKNFPIIQILHMADWKYPTVVFIIFSLLFLFFTEQSQKSIFQIDSGRLKYHSNWTSNYEKLPHQNKFKDALKLHNLKQLDLSFAYSSFEANFVSKLFTTPFSPTYQKARINFGSIPLKTPEIEYFLSLLPNNLKSLELYLDSMQIGPDFGVSFAYQMNRFTLLQQLTVSLILSATQHRQQMGIFFKLHKPRKNLKKLHLILIGNDFQAKHLAKFPQYLKKLDLESLDINLYANKIEAEGATLLAQSISTQQNLKRLNFDFYFNNLTEIGTKQICQKVKNLKKLTSLGLNFDFNFIKNEGGKYIGNLLSEMKNLTELQIGVASKNFGYLGFKSIIDGIKHLKNLTKLTLRCGVNRVGINGAQIVRDMLEPMTKLTYLDIGFVENYVGDEGLKMLSQTVSKMPQLKQVLLNLGFNDAQSYGLIQSLKIFSEKHYNYLYLGFSHNEFKDKDVELIKKYLPRLIKNNDRFDFDFFDTAISKEMAKQIEEIFENNNANYQKQSKLIINSIIQEEQQTDKEPELAPQTIKQQERIKSQLDLGASQKIRQEEKQKAEIQKKQKEQKYQQQKAAKIKAQRQERQIKQKQAKEKAVEEEKLKKEKAEQSQKQRRVKEEKEENQRKIKEENQRKVKQENDLKQKEARQAEQKSLREKVQKQALQKKQRQQKQRQMQRQKKQQRQRLQTKSKKKKQQQLRKSKEKAEKQERERKQRQSQHQEERKAQQLKQDSIVPQVEIVQSKAEQTITSGPIVEKVQDKKMQQIETLSAESQAPVEKFIEPEPVVAETIDPKLIFLNEEKAQL